MGKGVLEPSYRKRVGYQAALLGGMAMFASAALVTGNLHTQGDIAKRQAEDLQRSLNQVVPSAVYDNNLLTGTIKLHDKRGVHVIFRATKMGQFSGAAFEVNGNGYSGDIRLIMGVDKQGKILGVRVLQHAETPGLGDKIETNKSSWILSFTGHSLSNTTDSQWAVKKDGGQFDQFTGATITPRGVVKAVHQGLLFFQSHEGEIASGNTANGEDATNE